MFHWLGAALAACGAIGLLLAVMGAPSSAIDAVGGVVPGFLLLGFAWLGTLDRHRHLPGRQVGIREGTESRRPGKRAGER